MNLITPGKFTMGLLLLATLWAVAATSGRGHKKRDAVYLPGVGVYVLAGQPVKGGEGK